MLGQPTNSRFIKSRSRSRGRAPASRNFYDRAPSGSRVRRVFYGLYPGAHPCPPVRRRLRDAVRSRRSRNETGAQRVDRGSAGDAKECYTRRRNVAMLRARCRADQTGNRQ
jgi:hypothetical protein